MKSKFSLLLLFITCISFSQQKSSDREFQYEHEFSFELAENNGTISILKYETPTVRETYLILTTEIEICRRSEGMTLFFKSDETLSFKDSEIECESLPNGKRKLTSTLLLPPELYKKLWEIELKSFNIGTIYVPADFKEDGESFEELLKLVDASYISK